MFAFCSLIIGIDNGNDDSEKNTSQKLFENMTLCIVCEEEAKHAVSVLLNALSLFTEYFKVQDVVYTHLKHLDSDSLYLHKLANDIMGELEQDQYLHLLVLMPINKLMVPGIDKDVSSKLSYTALTGINNSMSFPILLCVRSMKIFVARYLCWKTRRTKRTRTTGRYNSS